MFVCALTVGFKCTMPVADGVADGNLPLVCGDNNITFGGVATAGTLTDGFNGGMEEVRAARVPVLSIALTSTASPAVGLKSHVATADVSVHDEPRDGQRVRSATHTAWPLTICWTQSVAKLLTGIGFTQHALFLSKHGLCVSNRKPQLEPPVRHMH